MGDPGLELRSILVPLDGSPFSEHALPLARVLARAADATVEVVLVHRSLIPDRNLEGLASIERLDGQVRSDEVRLLEGVAEQLQSAGVNANARLLEGPAIARALLDHAEASGTDLVIMCTHGRGGFARAWLGSVADEMARSATIPILLVRPASAPPSEGIEAPDHIVAALATREDHATAQRYLAPLARLFGARVTLLRIIPPPLRLAGRSFGPDEARYRAVSARATSTLDELARRFGEAGVEAQGRVLSHAQPASAILDFASAQQAGLLAIGAGRRSGPERLILGSVADKVVRGDTVPVLLLPSG